MAGLRLVYVFGVVSVMGALCGGTELWLNELNVEVTGGNVKVGYEIVGRPQGDYPTTPTGMAVKVNFYAHDDVAGNEVSVTLAPDDGFAKSYMKEVEDDDTRGDAFSRTASDKGGMRIVFEDQPDPISLVYCWGSGIDATTTVGPDDDKQTCTNTVHDNTMNTGDDSKLNRALWNKQGDASGGENEEDFEWSTSLDDTTSFSTLGAINKCPDAPSDCGDLEDQVIADYSYKAPPANDNEDKMWLNEIYVSGASTSMKVSLEFVGRPASIENQNQPASITGTFQFYNSNGEVGGSATATLTAVETGWNGSYRGTNLDLTGLEDAVPSDGALAGLKLTYLGVESIYCWGTDADVNSEIGESGSDMKCQNVVQTGRALKTASEDNINRSLFNRDDTPDVGGAVAKDFYWTDAKSEGVPFETLGNVNTCTGTSCSTIDQEIAEYTWTGSSSSSSSSTTSTSYARSTFFADFSLVMVVAASFVVAV